MDTKLAGKRALVAASSKGIGFACAEALAGEGCRLVICSRDKKAIEAARDRLAASGADVSAVACDLASPGGPGIAVGHAMAVMGGVDVLVTNTGGPPSLEFEQAQESHWTEAFQNLFMSAQQMISLTLPGMVKSGWGRVIAITSCACREPIPGLILSNSVRTAIHGLLKTLSHDHGHLGVTFNAVLPGYTLTDRVMDIAKAHAARSGTTPEAYIAQRVAAVPLKRAARAEEIAAAVVFLASEQASYVNGASIPVDGGAGRFVL